MFSYFEYLTPLLDQRGDQCLSSHRSRERLTEDTLGISCYNRISCKRVE